MADRELVITHLQIIHTWAEFASERDLQFFTKKHLEDIAQWSDDAINLLKEQETWHWIDTTKVIGFPRVQCSVCGSGQGAIWMNHCPNCGAKMEGR